MSADAEQMEVADTTENSVSGVIFVRENSVVNIYPAQNPNNSVLHVSMMNAQQCTPAIGKLLLSMSTDCGNAMENRFSLILV